MTDEMLFVFSVVAVVGRPWVNRPLREIARLNPEGRETVRAPALGSLRRPTKSLSNRHRLIWERDCIELV
jgi:hypothetical protein